MAINKCSQWVNLFAAILLSLGLVYSETRFSYGAATTDSQSPEGFECASVNEIPTQECLALVALYNATGGPAWQRNFDWLYTTTPCTWYGVECQDGHVYQVGLYHNNLTGTIPPEIGTLPNLTQLDLADNALSGAIPPELVNLTNLTALELDNNELSGAIPPELATLTSLSKLDLSSNQLSGTIPLELGALTNLTWLELDYNQLSGGIPPQLVNLPNLSILSLSNNHLSGMIPPQLGNFRSLAVLNVSHNQLSGAIPPQLGNLADLYELDLAANQLSGVIPPEIGTLTNLTLLSLRSNQLSGAIPPQLGNLTRLSHLYLTANQLSGTIPPELGNLRNLFELGLSGNQLSGVIPPQFGTFNHLLNLSLSNNRLSGTIPPELGNLRWLIILSLSNNHLSGTIPPELGHLGRLDILDVSSNQLSGAIPETFSNLPGLAIFSFHSTRLCEPSQPAFQAWITHVNSVQRTGDYCIALLVHDWEGVSATGYDCADWDIQAMEYSPTNPDVTEMSNIAENLYEQGYRVFAARWTTRRGYDIKIDQASECLREQIYDVTHTANTPGKIVLVADGMGGLVSRAYIEGDSYNGDVSQFITYGTPHAGIEHLFRLLATLPAGKVVCRVQPGTCQLSSITTGWYNLWHQPNPDVPYNIIGGDANPGFLAPLVQITAGDNDGFIGAYSANGYSGPTGWLTEIEGDNLQRWRTQGSHHPLFGEPTYFTDDATLDCLNHFLNNTPVGNCDSAPAPRPPTAPMGEAVLSLSPIYSGTITDSTTYTLPITIEGNNATFVTAWNTANLTFTLHTPSGMIITPATVGTIGGTYESTPATDWGAAAVYTLPDPQAGVWQAILTFTEVESPGIYTFYSTMDSEIHLIPVVPSAVVKNAPFVVSAILMDGSTPLSDGQVQATLTYGNITQTSTLTETQPGHYEGSLVAPASPTLYSLSITASGDTPLPYAREEISTLVVRDNLVTANGTPLVQGVDTNHNGLFEALRITTPLNSILSGPYALNVTLSDPDGVPVAQTSNIITLFVGNQTVSFDIKGVDISAAGRDGPYTVTLQVVANDPIALVGEANPLVVTTNYAASDFEVMLYPQLYLPLIQK